MINDGPILYYIHLSKRCKNPFCPLPISYVRLTYKAGIKLCGGENLPGMSNNIYDIRKMLGWLVFAYSHNGWLDFLKFQHFVQRSFSRKMFASAERMHFAVTFLLSALIVTPELHCWFQHENRNSSRKLKFMVFLSLAVCLCVCAWVFFFSSNSFHFLFIIILLIYKLIMTQFNSSEWMNE